MLYQLYQAEKKVFRNSAQNFLPKVHIPVIASMLYQVFEEGSDVISLENALLSQDETLKNLLLELDEKVLTKLGKVLAYCDFIFTAIFTTSVFRVVNQATSFHLEDANLGATLLCIRDTFKTKLDRVVSLVLSELRIITSFWFGEINEIIQRSYDRIPVDIYLQFFTRSGYFSIDKTLPKTSSILKDSDPQAAQFIAKNLKIASKLFERVKLSQLQLIDLVSLPMYYQLKTCEQKQLEIEKVLSIYQTSDVLGNLTDVVSSTLPEILCVVCDQCLTQ